MRRHGLVEREAGGADALVDVASRLCGLHAQVMSSAELTAFARIDGLEPGDVASALWDHARLVKTWAMRGTLHLLPGDELAEWHARVLDATSTSSRARGCAPSGSTTADEVEELIAEIGDALDGRTLTREELAAAIPHHGDKLRESWGSALKPAAFRGLLAFAPSEGQTVRFTRPPEGERPPAEDAVRAVTRRYLAAYAPARREDLSRWWGTHALSAAKAQKRFEALGDEVVAGRRRGRALLGARRRPRRDARRRAARRRAAAAALRPVRRQLQPRRRGAAARGREGARVPPGGLDLAGRPRRRRDRRRLDATSARARASRSSSSRSRSCRGGRVEQVEADAERLAAYLGGELTLRGTS